MGRETCGMRRRAGKSGGFTLIEILVVIAIILIVGTLVVVALRGLYKAVKNLFGMADGPAPIVVVLRGAADGRG